MNLNKIEIATLIVFGVGIGILAGYAAKRAPACGQGYDTGLYIDKEGQVKTVYQGREVTLDELLTSMKRQIKQDRVVEDLGSEIKTAPVESYTKPDDIPEGCVMKIGDTIFNACYEGKKLVGDDFVFKKNDDYKIGPGKGFEFSNIYIPLCGHQQPGGACVNKDMRCVIENDACVIRNEAKGATP